MATTSLALKGLLVLVLWAIYTIASACFSRLRKVPGPFAARFTNLWWFRRMGKGNFSYENVALHRKYGPLVRLGPRHISIDDPSALKTVYGISAKFAKSDWYQAFSIPRDPALNIFTEQNIQRHIDFRKQIQNMYSLTTLVAYEPFADECMDLLITRLEERAQGGRATIDLASWFQSYAFDVIACITIGYRIGFLDSDEGVKDSVYNLHESVWYSSLVGIFPALHPLLFPLSAKLGIWGSRGLVAMSDFVNRHLAKRREERKYLGPDAQDTGRTPDVIDRMLDKHMAQPDKTTEWHVFMVGLSNITAGSDTTGSTVSGVFYHILKNPHVLAKLMDEIHEFDAKGELSERPTFKEAQKMPYLNAVLKESLRLHSAVGLPLWRVVPEGGVEIAGQFLPAGTNVGFNSWVAHRNMDIWGTDADIFRPERWLEARAEADMGNSPERLQKMEAYFLPFGLGARTCIGRHISMFEISKLVPRLLRDFTFELAKPEMECDRLWLVLPNGLYVRLRKNT